MQHRTSFIVSFFLFIVVFTGSCYTSQLTLNVLMPADTVLPESLQKISILPIPGISSASGQFDSLMLNYTGDPYHIKMGYIHGIYQVLSESPRFSLVKLTDTVTAPFIRNTQIYQEDLDRICKIHGTDAVLVLSKAVSYARAEEEFAYSFSDYTLLNKTRWIFYQPHLGNATGRFNFTDTVTLAGEFSEVQLSDLLYEACYVTGINCGKRLVPYWQEVNRVIYTGPGRDLRDAAEFALKDRWHNSGLMWNDLTGNKKKKFASRASFNLAVAFERDDDLQQAYLWITYADSLQTNELTSLYKKILNLRVKNSVLLDLQMTGK
jgi:hypothetical protein